MLLLIFISFYFYYYVFKFKSLPGQNRVLTFIIFMIL